MSGIQANANAPADQMNNNNDHKRKLEAIMKNINTISLEVKKMREQTDKIESVGEGGNDKISEGNPVSSDARETVMDVEDLLKRKCPESKELSQLLLCDLTVHFGQTVKPEALKEAEQSSPPRDESAAPDASHDSTDFSV